MRKAVKAEQPHSRTWVWLGSGAFGEPDEGDQPEGWTVPEEPVWTELDDERT